MEQVVVREQPDRASPFERGQRGLHRATVRVVERQQPGRLIGAKEQVRQPLGSIEEAANRQRPGGRHDSKLKLRPEY
jgi:hypothetical protein